ncbi:hypothetical protein [Nocardia sp. CA-119907]|uniref:hypothetical protein n=1 Tax=Nocardia sp. CA-119907 TaxID=3239973 RepID=UPI003D962385
MTNVRNLEHSEIAYDYGLARRDENRCCKGGLADGDDNVIALTLSEIRRLLVEFVLTRLHPATRWTKPGCRPVA